MYEEIAFCPRNCSALLFVWSEVKFRLCILWFDFQGRRSRYILLMKPNKVEIALQCLHISRTTVNRVSGHGNSIYNERLNFLKIKGTGFDNSDWVVSVQNIKRKIKFVPHFNHNLNSCSVHASAVNASAITIFRVIARFCSFLTSSSNWGNGLSSHIKVIMNCLLATRWSACYEGIRAVKTRFQGVIQLQKIVKWEGMHEFFCFQLKTSSCRICFIGNKFRDK